MERFPQTFDEVAKAKIGHVFLDEYDDGIRFVILRGGGSLCAYVGVPKTHPISGFDYDDLPIGAHGGLTYAGTGIVDDESMWFYGWDYAHSGDRSAYDHNENRSWGRDDWGRDEKEWTVAEVYEDCWDVRWDFAKLVRLAEKMLRHK